MSHYGRLGSYQFHDSAEDVRGSNLYGFDDEKLGKIDDVIFNHASGDITYVVVDTGGWLTTKKFVVPANSLRTSTKHEEDFECDLTKEQIETFPPYNADDLQSEDRWNDYDRKYQHGYRAKWEAGPVMHRAETDRNITPTTQQQIGNPSSLRASEGTNVTDYPDRDLDVREQEQEADIRAAQSPTGRVVPAGTDSVVIENSAAGIGGRWDTFQARLRERRKEASAECASCGAPPASARGESTDTVKKAV